MSYIIKENSAFLNTKITDIGRQKLSLGSLNFTYFRLGDSEICYSCYPDALDYSGFNILRPKDNNPDIKYPLYPDPTNLTGSTFLPVDILDSSKSVINNIAKPRGFFTGITNNFTAFTTSTYIKQVLYSPISGMTGGNIISLKSGSSTNFFYQPSINDKILVKYGNPYLTNSLSVDYVEPSPIPYLWYQIEGVSGYTSANTLEIQVDRTLPNFSQYIDITANTNYNYISFFPSGDSINNFYGYDTPIPYWNERTLSFDSNCSDANLDVPVWNMNIVFTETQAGISGDTFETYELYGSTGYSSTKEYLNYYSTSGTQKSIAILHYTNNTISNFYGEGFYLNDTQIHIPTLMYHRKKFTGGSGFGDQIGYSFSANTQLKQIVSPFDTNSYINYYDLVDSETDKTIVGKVFPDLKIITIEDEEIVGALSYKSNRNWTLPKPTLSVVPLGTCDTTATTGVLKTPADELYVTYLLESLSGFTTGLHCQYYSSVYSETTGERDVTIEFPIDSFPYLKPLAISGGTGFEAHKIKAIMQRVGRGSRPEPDKWLISDITYQLTCSSCPLDGKDIEGTKLYITDAVYNSGVTYNLNEYIKVPLLTEPNNLQFGDEVFFYGNINSGIKADIYSSLFTFVVSGNRFALSQNPTFDPDVHSVNISEIGIYDSDFQMVGIAKPSQPIKRPDNGGVIALNISIDF